jgi:hypothetical protein
MRHKFFLTAVALVTMMWCGLSFAQAFEPTVYEVNQLKNEMV